VDNFTNHYQSRIFYKDGDWPGKNMKRWSLANSRPKWKWLLYDTDHGFGSWGSGSNEIGSRNTLNFVTEANGPSWPNPPKSTFMLRKLLTNQNYRNYFINRFSLLIETYFTTGRILQRKSFLEAQIQSEISYDATRWSSKSEFSLPSSITTFASSRQASMQSELRTCSFCPTDTPVNLTLKVNGNGKILVHNLEMLGSTVTFSVFPSVPITIKAVGSSFSGWSNGSTKAEQKNLTITRDSTITAYF